jgi:hypothetical protein
MKPPEKKINTKNWMILVEQFQHLHYAKLRKQEVKKIDFLFKFGKNKQIAEKVWECFVDQGIEWPHEMYDRIFDFE